MSLPISINENTPIGTDSPADGPTHFQDIKGMLVGVFGITNDTSYTLEAMRVDPTDSTIRIMQPGFRADNIRLLQGTLTDATGNEAIRITATWNSSTEEFTMISCDLTVTTAATTSKVFDLNVGGSDLFTLYSTGEVAFGADAADAGFIRLPNAQHIKARNSTNSANVELIGLNANNRVTIANGGDAIIWGTPAVSTGGGASTAAFAIDTVGGADQPASAQQAGWLKVRTSTGLDARIPFWV
jgi:hypothetical protein